MEINYIKNWCSFNMVPYYEIPDASITKIYTLLKTGTGDEPKSDVELLYYGTYALYNLKPLDAMKYLTESIIKGNVRAISMMGVYYYTAGQDMANMWKYLNMGSDKKDPYAIYFMGVYHFHTKDYVNAERYFRQAMDAEFDIAIYYLALLFKAKGDSKRMKEYCTLAASRGVTRGMSMMGSYYIERKKYKKAKRYLQMGIDVEDPLCIYYMGLCCKRQGLYDDMKKYYQQAAELDCALATYKLGRYYRIHDKDYDNMAKYLKLGVNLKYSPAMVELGDHCFDFSDYHNTEKYYIMAAKNGSTIVIPKLYILYSVVGKPNMAKYWLTQMKK